MRTVWAVVAALLLASSADAADKWDALSEARALYNRRDFAGALAAADAARLMPGRAESADLIAARAYLERFRETAEPTDLASARERLRRLAPDRLSSIERLELIVGLGEALYFDGLTGAAAGVFESLFARNDLALDSRERVLDWWASALDREGQQRGGNDRPAVYQRILDRMREELGTNPGSGVASYWIAAAERARGDWRAAWDAAQAGWVRASLVADGGAALRGDLDRLVDQAIVAERARAIGQTPDAVRAEWEQFKDKWNK
jgi:hypothetical protein